MWNLAAATWPKSCDGAVKVCQSPAVQKKRSKGAGSRSVTWSGGKRSSQRGGASQRFTTLFQNHSPCCEHFINYTTWHHQHIQWIWAQGWGCKSVLDFCDLQLFSSAHRLMLRKRKHGPVQMCCCHQIQHKLIFLFKHLQWLNILCVFCVL